MSDNLNRTGLDAQKHAGKTTRPASGFKLYINGLAAVSGLCCQLWAAPALTSEGQCPGVDGSDPVALEQCLLKEICIEGIYDPPRTLSLPSAAITAYRAAEIDVSDRHFKLYVRFRKRADSANGQCDYESPNSFMFSLVEPASPTTVQVTFDPKWVY